MDILDLLLCFPARSSDQGSASFGGLLPQKRIHAIRLAVGDDQAVVLVVSCRRTAKRAEVEAQKLDVSRRGLRADSRARWA